MTATVGILVGMDAPNGRPPTVVGISEHLDDAALRNSFKTQRPDPIQSRSRGNLWGSSESPFRSDRFKQAFGGLEKETVYIHRESSTVIAKIDEIAKMGGSVATLAASEIDVQFCDRRARVLLEGDVSLSSTVLQVDKPDEIPDYEAGLSLGNGFAISMRSMGNVEYYREYVEYVQQVSMLRPLVITAANRGKVTAASVRLELTIPNEDAGVLLISEDGYPFHEPDPGLDTHRADSYGHFSSRPRAIHRADFASLACDACARYLATGTGAVARPENLHGRAYLSEDHHSERNICGQFAKARCLRAYSRLQRCFSDTYVR